MVQEATLGDKNNHTNKQTMEIKKHKPKKNLSEILNQPISRFLVQILTKLWSIEKWVKLGLLGAGEFFWSGKHFWTHFQISKCITKWKFLFCFGSHAGKYFKRSKIP